MRALTGADFINLCFIDNAGNIVQGTDIKCKSFSQFTGICQIVACGGILQHRSFGANFSVRGICNHSAFCVASARKKTNIGIEIADETLGFTAYISQ